jgi:site-specific recombinase XerD
MLHDDRHRLMASQKPVEAVDRFLSALETRGLSPHTVRAYAFDLLALYRWLRGRPEGEASSVEELKQSDLWDFVRDQRSVNAKPASINRRLTVASLLYRFLTGKHIGASSGAGVILPAAHYKGRGRDRDLGLHLLRAPRYRALRVKTPQTIVEPLTAEQARLLIGSFERYRDIAIAYLMLLCGLRSREVLALEVGDVDFDKGRLLVSGKGGKERVLPLPPLLVRYLRNYLRLERPSVCKTKVLFVVLKGHRRGRAMTVSGLRSLFRYRRRNAKLENANPHRLRHTFGTDMARSGVRLPILQKMMGHSDSKMTLKYINLSIADVAAEFQRAAKEVHKRYTGEE